MAREVYNEQTRIRCWVAPRAPFLAARCHTEARRSSRARSAEERAGAMSQRLVQHAKKPDAGKQQGFERVETMFEMRIPLAMLRSKRIIDLVAGYLGTVLKKKRKPPCEGAIFVRIVGTTTECVNHKVVFVDTLEWICPPDNHVETTVERTVTDSPC